MVSKGMQGFITERDCELMELVFPGINRFYQDLQPKPRTFLELLWRFQDTLARVVNSPLPVDVCARRQPL